MGQSAHVRATGASYVAASLSSRRGTPAARPVRKATGLPPTFDVETAGPTMKRPPATPAGDSKRRRTTMRKRYRLAAAATTLAVALACNDNSSPVAPSALSPNHRPALTNSPVTGAVFTTTDPDVDGTGHCQNGNEAVNCNIYDGKQYVWLTGGPGTSSLAPGNYFFAVMAPGGQGANRNPNDGTPKKL